LNDAVYGKKSSFQRSPELKGFLAFRHFVRHAYSFEIDPETIIVIIRKAPKTVRQFIDEISLSQLDFIE
jgi:hypothetical protein